MSRFCGIVWNLGASGDLRRQIPRVERLQAKPLVLFGCKIGHPHDVRLCGTLTILGMHLGLFKMWPRLHNMVADVLIFDEAGQATDPDLLMGIVGQLSKTMLLVIAGDTQQLGPVVPSVTASHNSLGNVLATSAMQRMRQAYPHFTRVALTQNYRGHPSTLAMSSEIFYDGQMTVGGDPARWDTTRLAGPIMKMMRGAEFKSAIRNRPMALNNNRQFFFNVIGSPRQEDQGTSWFNPAGVRAVVTFVQMLLDNGARASDIGIISMYGEDVRRIKQFLRAVGIHVDVAEAVPDPEVSSVDAFQGREKSIILVHFVAAFNGLDPWKFVKSPRRLNVATTRSKEFQFMFGNMTFWKDWQSGLTTPMTSTEKMEKVMKWVHDKGQMVDWAEVRPMKNYPKPEF